MHLIQYRILWKVFARTLFVFCFVGVVATTTQVLNEVHWLIDASSSIWVPFKMFAHLMPSITVVVLPLSFLIACINVYDQMDEHRETVILSGAGAHPGFVLVPAGLVAGVLSGLVLFLSLQVEPAGNRVVREIIYSLKYDAVRIIAGNGVLREVQNGLFIRGGGFDENGDIDGLFILDRRNPAEEVSYIAQTARFVEVGDEEQLLLFNGSIQIRQGEDDSVHRVRFGRYETTATALFEEPSEELFSARQVATAELRATFAESDPRYDTWSRMRKELIRRYTDWLYPLVFAAIVAFVVLTTRPSRTGARWRLPAAVLSGFVVKALGLVLLGSAGSSGFAATASFAMPVAVVVLLLMFAFPRATRGRPPSPMAARARARPA